MEVWFSILVRQCMLYSFPLLLSLTTIALLEHRFLQRRGMASLQLFWQGSLLPLAATLLFGRAIIFSLPYPTQQSLKAAWIRFLGHLLLAIIGWLLYSWALTHPPPSGLPPLHHWWAKVLMYLNLCLLALHLLPLPNMVMGELLLLHSIFKPWVAIFRNDNRIAVVVLTILAASPLLDMFLGGAVIFPVYEQLASLAE